MLAALASFPVQGQAPAGQVFSGGHHTCVVTPAGGVSCWGSNKYGQLGDGTNLDSAVPVAVSGLASGVVSIAAGGDHNCALTTAGAVACWGWNDYGQLGDGTTLSSKAPRNVPGLAGIVALEAGEFHTCALDAAGGVKCWGNNYRGQVGDATNLNRPTPTAVVGLSSGVREIASGQWHTCALLEGGAKCWGANEDGQLGSGAIAAQGLSTPVAVVALADPIESISTGRFHTCAVTTSGAAKCWGRNVAGQLGNGQFAPSASPNELAAVSVVGLSSGVRAIDAGFTHTCAVLADASARCWGMNDHGQLGNGSINPNGVPVPGTMLGLGSGVAAISASFEHTCVLTLGGSVRCAGLNTDGRIGNGAAMPRPDVATAESATGFTASVAASGVSVGTAHACQVGAGGAVWCWGRNDEGQLGDGGNVDSALPVAVAGLSSGAASIATGGRHSCAVVSGGAIRCWGSNDAGQLGVAGGNQNVPVEVPGLAGVTAIVAGDSHTCARTSTGGVACWGGNARGQLGDGTTLSRYAPQPVPGIAGVSALSSGEFHACAVSGGAAKCWGWNGDGQLGNGTTALNGPSGEIASPVDVAGAGGAIEAIAAGGSHTCAVVSGAAKCWGRGDSGQLGNDAASGSLVPVTVSGLASGVAGIAAGGAHSCALTSATSGRAALCWGDNGSGQLGIGEPDGSSTVPIAVAGFAGGGVASIDAGAAGTCAVTAGNWTRCWGANASGQVGDGSTVARSSQAEVMVRAQAIDFAPALVMKAGTHSPLAANALSGLPAAYGTWPPGRCSVSGNALTPDHVGLCGVFARQEGNAQFMAAPPQLRVVVVVKGDQAITFTPPGNKTYGSPPFVLSATGGASGNAVTLSSFTPAVCTVAGGTVTILSAGTCTIAANQAGNADYNPAPQATLEIAVAKEPQSISFPAIGTRALGEAFTAAATASSGLPVTVASLTAPVCTVAGASVTLVGLGTCTLAADQAGNANYEAAARVTQGFAVITATVPGAPVIGAATPGNGRAAIYFSPPASNGGGVITGYTATCNPGNVSATGPSSPITVTGLVNGTTYSCYVRARNIAGTGAPSAAVSVTPRAAQLAVTPAALDFGGQSMGTASPPLAITLTNTGTGPATIASITISNGQFEQASNCGTLQAGATCRIAVEFWPLPASGELNSKQPVSASLTIVSDAPGSPHQVALAGIAEKSLVTHYYQSILGRTPDPAGKEYWESESARMAALGADVHESVFAMAAYFYFSPEYLALQRDPAGFVTDLYNTFFNRPPDAGGLAFWTDQVSTGLPREVALASFMFSAEFSTFTHDILGHTEARTEVNMVMDFYRGLLARLPDEAGFEYWVQRFRIAQCRGVGAVYAEADAISALFLSGAEYASRGRTDEQFVGDLYNAFLRRGGDKGGVLFWVSQVASGARTRDAVRTDFIGTPEFGARMDAIVAQGCLR